MTNGLITDNLAQVNSMLENILNTRTAAAAENDNSVNWSPEVDSLETADEFVLQVALPGVNKEEVETEIKENILTIAGTRTARYPVEAPWFRREIPTGRFYRAFKINARVKTDAVKAALKDGILEVRIPKADEEKPSRIRID